MICLPSRVGEWWLGPDFDLIESVTHMGNGLVDLWEASPIRLHSNEPKTDEIIDILFPGNPFLCCGWSRHRFDTRPRNRWYKLHALPFIVPNPMTAPRGLTRQGRLSARRAGRDGRLSRLIVVFGNYVLLGPLVATLRVLHTPVTSDAHSPAQVTLNGSRQGPRSRTRRRACSVCVRSRAHRDGGRLIVRADEVVTEFLELERTIHEFAVSLMA
jgi:hypothetical protein